MKIRKVTVERFRGINKLDWVPGGDFVCLIGPNDSTKTTILDAIELALSPRWNVSIDDADFFDAETDQPIVITVTVGDLPDEFKSDERFGFLSRGWGADGTLHDEPQERDELVLSIELRIGASLEPNWAVVNDRNTDGKRIGADDRDELGCARLGDFLDRHFSWAPGSSLARLTGKRDKMSALLADVSRAARATVGSAPPERMEKLKTAAEAAARAGAAFGVAPKREYKPQLDIKSISPTLGGIALHDGDVPLRRAGLGTRRLLAVAIQHEMAKSGGVLLIDEIEHGLEPHRIRHVLRELFSATRSKGQVFLTTHAPVVLQELAAEQLRVVRSSSGSTSILAVDRNLQSTVLTSSEAFLARRVLVCEGKTKLGFCRRLDDWWKTTGSSFGLTGVGLVDGGGSAAPTTATIFAKLGYRTALLADADEDLNPDVAALQASNVMVVQWDEHCSIEQRIALDVPWGSLMTVVQLAMDFHGENLIRGEIESRLGEPRVSLSGKPSQWHQLGVDDHRFRAAIGLASAKHKVNPRTVGWFKRVDRAIELAGIVVDCAERIVEKDLGRKITALKAWAHGAD